MLSSAAAESTSPFAFLEERGEGSSRRREDGLFQARASLQRETNRDPFRHFGAPLIQMPSEPAEDIGHQPSQWQSRAQETSSSLFAPAVISPQQQPATPHQPDEPSWIDQLARGMGELVVHSEAQPGVQDRPEEMAWIDELSRSMGELVVQGEQQAAPGRFPAPQLEFRPQYTDLMDDFDQGMSELGAQWQEQAVSRARHPLPVHPSIRPAVPRNRFAPPSPVRPRPPAAPPVSLNTLAGDASVLLELFSQRPGDSDDITGEHETMITSAAVGITAIQARLRQRGNSNIGSREQRSRDADCVICYSNGADVVFMPCKHLVVCTVRIPLRGSRRMLIR